MGFVASDAGFDVFLGNYRGIYPRKLSPRAEKDKNYWDYSIDHIAKYDIAAFIDKIFEIKLEELKTFEPEKVKKFSD